MKGRLHRIGIAVIVVAVYVGAYGVLRSRYAITHHSNADHPYADKRSPGHFVHATCKHHKIEWTLAITFWPLMRMEERVHDWRG